VASVRQSVSQGGDGRAPIVLIHGFSGSRGWWDAILAPLESSFEVLPVTLAGHVGGPELGDTPVSVGALVDAVERDMDAAGFETAHLVGCSLGGWIAFELAERGRARSIVLISPAGGWETGSRAARRLRSLFIQLHKLSTAMLPRLDSLVRRSRLRRVLLWRAVAHGERVPPTAAAALVRNSVECPVYFELLDAMTRDRPPEPFDGATCPVLIAWGTKDRILPRRSYSPRFHELLPSAEWVTLRGLGHLPMLDDPELVARMIVEFAARVGERAAVRA
jgi:pimeloyl-ACP methyl ester carboxylesterase